MTEELSGKYTYLCTSCKGIHIFTISSTGYDYKISKKRCKDCFAARVISSARKGVLGVSPTISMVEVEHTKMLEVLFEEV